VIVTNLVMSLTTFDSAGRHCIAWVFYHLLLTLDSSAGDKNQMLQKISHASRDSKMHSTNVIQNLFQGSQSVEGAGEVTS